MAQNFFTLFSSVDTEKLFERIFVALLIMFALDLWKRWNEPPEYRASPPLAAAPVMTYEPMEKTESRPLSGRLVQQVNDEKHPIETGSNDDSSEKLDTTTTSSVKKESRAIPPKKASNKSASVAARTTARSQSAASSSSSAPTTAPPPITAKTNHHPGMQGFCEWYEVEASLYRIYTLGRHDGVQVVPPYIPHSSRGKVAVNLHVTNQTNTIIQVYWVDYKGKHILKGTLKPNHAWVQTTWIDHPWVFEGLDAQDCPTPYLYYVPYRVIPTLPEAPTVNPDDPDTGLHRFSIVPAKSSSPYYCGVQDTILPFPAETYFTTPLLGITWTLIHMSRVSWPWKDPTMDLIQKYLTNIINAPETTKYRQLRISSPKFGPIWNSPLKGLLLAVGFVQVQGFAELGCADKPLARERIQDLALLSYLIAQWRDKEKKRIEQHQQPEGADGYGRAGFGRMTGMN